MRSTRPAEDFCEGSYDEALRCVFQTVQATYAGCMQNAPEPPIKDPAQEDASKSDALRIYSMEEVEKHDTRDSTWFVHKGQVRAF